MRGEGEGGNTHSLREGRKEGRKEVVGLGLDGERREKLEDNWTTDGDRKDSK